jgi:hypothetical protein
MDVIGKYVRGFMQEWEQQGAARRLS